MEALQPLVDGEDIKWTRHNLNFQMGGVGWVMHEYVVAENPSLKICSIAFTGHCKKSMRAPDGYNQEGCLAAGEPVTQRPRVADDYASGSTTSFVQDMSAAQDFQDRLAFRSCN
ncbi:hypothetical protein PR202_ga07134 [Eleusine coracana subsp. coracana]|uniref:Uncharacterized protein n=1 Tax=Eleusine coracana subsp. coracana TaxID=191504 RepID=A0AAV5BZ73_ELECO|nr:hypothetical protein PR202_ga07134 [Eleusine coracana subsp. coracana]